MVLEQTSNATLWFEFLLDSKLLEKHLSQATPDPSPGDLIALFLYQADVAAATAREIKEGNRNGGSDNDPETPDIISENKKIKALKFLALKVAAYLKWDLQMLDEGVPLAMVQDILLELLKLTMGENADPIKHKMQDLTNLSGEALFAMQLYHRWCLKTAVETTFPVKPQKLQNVQVPGLLDPNAATASAKETVLQIIREGMDDSLQMMVKLCDVSREVRMPTLASIGGYEGDQDVDHDWSKSDKVSPNEFLCQASYDLGVVFFFQQKYMEAYQRFTKAKELKAILLNTVYLMIQEARLGGYLSACSGMLGTVPLSPAANLVQRMEAAKRNNFQGVGALLREDNIKRELSMPFRLALEYELKRTDSLRDLYAEVVVFNAVRRVLDTRLLQLEFLRLIRARPALLGLLLDLCGEMVASCSRSQEASIKHMLRYLAHSLDPALDFTEKLLRHPALCTLFPDEDCLPSRAPAPPRGLSGDHPQPLGEESRELQTHKLERLLLVTYEPAAIKELVTKLSHQVSKTQLDKLKLLSDTWKVPKEILNLIDPIPIPWVKLYTYVLVAKAGLCGHLKLYERAKELLSVAEATTKDLSIKLARILPWEILRHDLLAYNEGKILQPSDQAELKKRVRGCLGAVEGKKERPHEEVVEACVAFLANTRDWDGLGHIYNARNGLMEFGRLLGALCKQLPHLNAARKPARDLWEAIVLVFTNSQQGSGAPAKRNNSGGLIQQQQQQPREARLGPVSRQQLSELLTKLTEPLAVSVLISLLARLFAALKDDSGAGDIVTEYTLLWPTTVATPGAVSCDAVTDALSALLSHALTTVSPTHNGWLRTQADVNFALSHHRAALRHYLLTAHLATDYFYEPLSKNVVDDALIKRLVRCCTNLQAHTQLVVLCQCLDEVDYVTAFKVLQEQRLSHDAGDTYYAYIWDITILEYLVNLHAKRGENDKKQVALKAISTPELNASNPPEILFEGARVRKARFFRSLLRQYVC